MVNAPLEMSPNAELHCTCGKVRGEVRNASRDTANHIVCYCDDCQAYLHHLGRSEWLDAQGGTDIVQVAPAALSFHEGSELIVALRLTPKGLYRWHSSCCDTPLGNTLTPRVPFVGIVAQAFAGRADEHFGRSVGGILGKYAIGTGPALNVPLIARAVSKVLSWKVRGRAFPHPFFDRATGAPRYPITVMSRAERESLRPLCGPHPRARTTTA